MEGSPLAELLIWALTETDEPRPFDAAKFILYLSRIDDFPRELLDEQKWELLKLTPEGSKELQNEEPPTKKKKLPAKKISSKVVSSSVKHKPIPKWEKLF